MAQREEYRAAIERDGDGRVQRIDLTAIELEGGSRHIDLNATKAARVAGPLHDLLRAGGVSGRLWSGRAPIDLSQHVGSHAELLLEAVKPLRRADRIDQVADGVAGMSREEAAYWHAKARRPGGLRALRILLTAGRAR